MIDRGQIRSRLREFVKITGLPRSEVEGFIGMQARIVEWFRADREITCHLSVGGGADQVVTCTFLGANDVGHAISFAAAGANRLQLHRSDVRNVGVALRLVGLLLAGLDMSARLGTVGDPIARSGAKHADRIRLLALCAAAGSPTEEVEHWVTSQAERLRRRTASTDVTCSLAAIQVMEVPGLELWFSFGNGDALDIRLDASGRTHLNNDWCDFPNLTVAFCVASLLLAELQLPALVHR